MTTLYKLTDSSSKTRAGYDNECVWGEGVTHTASGNGDLCTAGWIHAYSDPLLAMFFDPIHGDYSSKKGSQLWVAIGKIGKTDHGMKVGCTSLTTIREITKPKITMEQRITFGILCAQQVCANTDWCKWAKSWLSGANRTRKAAYAARAAAYAAYADADADAVYAANATYAAAEVANAAAYAAADAYAANAADAAARAGKELDLPMLAKKAINWKEGE